MFNLTPVETTELNKFKHFAFKIKQMIYLIKHGSVK